MVTNGYFLDEKTAELLAKNGVTHVQVTVDGPPTDIYEDVFLLAAIRSTVLSIT